MDKLENRQLGRQGGASTWMSAGAEYPRIGGIWYVDLVSANISVADNTEDFLCACRVMGAQRALHAKSLLVAYSWTHKKLDKQLLQKT